MPRFLSGFPDRIPSNSNAVVFCFEKSKRPVGAYIYGTSVDKALTEAAEDGFEGKKAQIAVVRPKDRRFTRYIFIGLGKEKEVTLDDVRRGASYAARRANAIGCKSIHVKPPLIASAAQTAQAIAEGVILGLYRFTAFQSTNAPALKLESVVCIAKDKEESSAITRGLNSGTQFAQSVTFARDLINRPPSDATPEYLAKEAKKLSGGGVSVKIFNKAQITKLGMGGLLGVNRGSGQPPYFVHLTYRSGTPRRKIGICGKGITFDSGGLSLKQAGSMETMKYDMSGAASVFAVFRALKALQPRNVEVQGFTPLTENMPGGNAVKPGDVLKTMRGKTIEVLNTDAEGRLVLADALSFASKQKLDEVIDIATLTGAATIALGNQIAAIMGSDAALISRLKNASNAAGEKVWELPLEKEYLPSLKSNVADIKNIGTPGQAGTIIAGLFLHEFVDPGLPWAHLDIASVGWVNSQTALSEAGATGAMIRSLLHHILSYN